MASFLWPVQLISELDTEVTLDVASLTVLPSTWSVLVSRCSSPSYCASRADWAVRSKSASVAP